MSELKLDEYTISQLRLGKDVMLPNGILVRASELHSFVPRSRLLQADIIQAALSLFGETKTAGFLLPVPRTTPQIFVVAGTKDVIEGLLK